MIISIQCKNWYVLKIKKRKFYCEVKIFYKDKDRKVPNKPICILQIEKNNLLDFIDALEISLPK